MSAPRRPHPAPGPPGRPDAAPGPARERGAWPGVAASAQAQCVSPTPPPSPPPSPPALHHRPETDRGRGERGGGGGGGGATPVTGSASDWQLRRLPPLCLVCSEPPEPLPGGARGVSQAPAAHPFLGHLRPSSRRPPPSARDAQSCGERGGGGGGGDGGFFFFLGLCCDSLLRAVDGRRPGFFHGAGISCRPEPSGGKSRQRGRGPSALGRPAGAAPHLPACGAPGLAGAAATRPSPPLPRAPRPGLLARLPARPSHDCSEEAVGSPMEAGTFFDLVGREDLLMSESE